MTASVMHLLDSLESRLAQAQAELHALRKENAQLKQQLVEQAVSLQETLDQPSASEQALPEERAVESRGEGQLATEPGANAAQETIPEHALAKRQPPSPHSLLKEWYQRYPKAFFKGHTKPLKVGIHQDLAAQEPWSGKLIRRALANYVNLPRYLKSVREGVERIDLDGQSAGKVDKEAALHASEKRKEKQGERLAQKTSQPIKKTPKQAKTHLADRHEEAEFKAAKKVASQKIEQEKPLSLEDKLKGLQQKFEGR